MTTSRVYPREVLAVRCPTCGADPGRLCVATNAVTGRRYTAVRHHKWRGGGSSPVALAAALRAAAVVAVRVYRGAPSGTAEFRAAMLALGEAVDAVVEGGGIRPGEEGVR